MAEQLFPIFDIPEIEEEAEDEEKYYPSVFFDFEKGDFVLDGAHRMTQAGGREAYMQWCLKMVDTERDACLAYSDDIGTEFEEMASIGDRLTRESEIKSTITDALMVHPCTEYVRNFKFQHEADSCWATFTVKGYGWEEQELTTLIMDK